MDHASLVMEAAGRVTEAIARRDVASLRRLLGPGFVHRQHGGPASDADAFLATVAAIPGAIRFVRLEHLEVDVGPHGALATGMQHAQLELNGELVDDRRGFVDWFVLVDGAWRLQAAVDLPPFARTA
jgi:hypothetical protein